LKDGDRNSPISIQKIFLETAMDWYEKVYKSEYKANESMEKVLFEWQNTLSLLESDPEKLSDRLDNRIKLSLINAYLERQKCSFKESLNKKIKVPDANGKIKEITVFDRLGVLDLAYHDLRETGIYRKMLSGGRIKRISSEDDIKGAMFYSPENTRAYLRSKIIKKFAENIRWINWCNIVGPDHTEIGLDDPLCCSKETVDEIIASAINFSDLRYYL
ncbi:MAG: proteasome accessory factor PafA2 family protein, partial [Patescibacteria group bacterium]|nr:proteasome accessory factor PafA2 family protein [Patescibacteria group bacterium]